MIKYFIYFFLTTILCTHACMYASYDFYMLEDGTKTIYFYQYCSSTVKISLIKNHTFPSSQYEKGDPNYLENIANKYFNNKNQLIFPDSLEIISGPGGWKKGSLTMNLYKNEQLIANDIRLVAYFPETKAELIHIKNPKHHLTTYFRPVGLLNIVQKVTYHNGWYPESVLTYDNNGTYALSSTWQHKLVQITTYGFIALLLYYIVSKL